MEVLKFLCSISITFTVPKKNVSVDNGAPEGTTEGNEGVDVIVPIIVPVIVVVLAITLGAICYIQRTRIRIHSPNVSKNYV